jgi:hypothetical protein
MLRTRFAMAVASIYTVSGRRSRSGRLRRIQARQRKHFPEPRNGREYRSSLHGFRVLHEGPRAVSSWPRIPRPWVRCYGRPAPFRSCSRRSPTRSAPVSSRAWHDRAATRLVHDFRIRHERKMAGAAQADRTRRDASGVKAEAAAPWLVTTTSGAKLRIGGIRQDRQTPDAR